MDKFITAYLLYKEIYLFFSCVLFWDTRPPKGPSQLLTKKTDDKGPKNPMGVPNTFKHLDLSWKPFLRVRFCHFGRKFIIPISI